MPPAARRRSLCQLTAALNKNEYARAEFDKWGLTIDSDIMQVCESSGMFGCQLVLYTYSRLFCSLVLHGFSNSELSMM